jgi:hypothetical protein
MRFLFANGIRYRWPIGRTMVHALVCKAFATFYGGAGGLSADSVRVGNASFAMRKLNINPSPPGVRKRVWLGRTTLCMSAAWRPHACARRAGNRRLGKSFYGCRIWITRSPLSFNRLSSPHSRRNYRFAMVQFINWYCSEPRLALNQAVVLRFPPLPRIPRFGCRNDQLVTRGGEASSV